MFIYDDIEYEDEAIAEMICPVIAFMAEKVEGINRVNGWFDEGRTFGDGIALIHSEVSEALEAYRDGDMGSVRDDGKPEGVASEFADILVRLLDESKRQSVDLGMWFLSKSEYNANRGYRHGGKTL